MIKTKAVLEISKGEKVYQLYCDADSPLGELYDILSSMKGIVLQKMQEAEPKPEGEPCQA